MYKSIELVDINFEELACHLKTRMSSVGGITVKTFTMLINTYLNGNLDDLDGLINVLKDLGVIEIRHSNKYVSSPLIYKRIEH